MDCIRELSKVTHLAESDILTTLKEVANIVKYYKGQYVLADQAQISR